MYYVKCFGISRLVFATTFENYTLNDPTIKHIEGFIIGQHPAVEGNFQISDLKEVTFTVSDDGLSASVKLTNEDYNYLPEAGDWIWVRLKDTNKTIQKLQVASVEYDNWVYQNDDNASYIQNKHNTATIVAQDWNTDNYINNGDTVTLGGLTEGDEDGDYEVVSITKPAGDTIFVLKNIADPNLIMTPEDPLAVTFTISKDIEVTEEAVGGVATQSTVIAKENKITIMANTTIVSDGIIQAGDNIVIANTTNNNSAGNTTNAYETVASNPEYLDVGETDSVIYIHNTTLADDMTDETLDGTDETITIVKDIETTANSAVYFSNQNSIDINYTGAVPEIADYLGAGESVVLANSDHNDGTYTIASVDDTQSGVIHIHVTEAITAPTETVGAGGTLTITDDVIYTNANASSNIIEKVSRIYWDGKDLTPSLAEGDSFVLSGTAANNGTYVVRAIDYNITRAGSTAITFDNIKQIDTPETYNVGTETITTDYKKYFATAGDTLVRAKSTLTVHDHDFTVANAVTNQIYINATDKNDIILRRDGETDMELTVETISGDGTDTIILLEEHVATIADIAGASIIAPDRTITYTNTSALSEIVAADSMIKIQCLTDAELDILTTYFDYPLGQALTLANCGSAGSYLIDSIDVDVPNKTFIIYVTDNTNLIDETLTGLDETLSIVNDFIFVAGTDSNITEVSAYLYIVGNVTLVDDGFIDPTDDINITGLTTNPDADYTVESIAKVNADADTRIYITEATKTIVNETLTGDEVIKIDDVVAYTNPDDTSESVIVSYAKIEWYGEDLTGYILQNETITLANCGVVGNDGIKNIVDNVGAVTWDATKTTIWIEENLEVEESLPIDPAVTITQENDIVCTVGSDDVTSFYATKTTEYLTWNTGTDLTAVKPYFLTGDTIEVYNSSDELIATVDIDTVTYSVPNMEIVFTNTSAITGTYPYGLSDNFNLISTDKSVTYTNTDATSSITTEVDRIVIDREIMPGAGVFTANGFITLDVGDNAGTYAYTTWEYNVGEALKTEIILDPTEHAWELTNEVLDIADTISYNGTYVYTEANGTDSAITSSEDFLLLKGVVVSGVGADANLKEFLAGDTVYLSELTDTVGHLNDALEDVALVIDTITDDGTDTTITFEEDDNYSKWTSFVYELLTDGADPVGAITTEDEAETYINVLNIDGIFGAAEETMNSYLITIPDTGVPETVVITNVDTNVPYTNIESVSDDNP